MSKGGIFEKLVPILLVLSVGLAFAVGLLWEKVSNLEKGGSTTAATGTTAGQGAPSVTLETIKGLWDKNIIKFGNANSKLLIVEVADPSCPYCHIAGGDDPEVAAAAGAQFKYKSDGGSYVPPVTEIKKLVDAGKASFAYIYFPGHGNGEMGMKALFCAYDQGKFWEANQLIMNEKGYEIQNGYDANQKTVTGTVIGNDANKSQAMADFLKGVTDPTKMKECLDSGKYDSRLTDEQNIASGTLGITGTPGFYVNTTEFPGAYSWTDMQSAVDAVLK